jgi:predicted adenylyl cyclase CyaB
MREVEVKIVGIDRKQVEAKLNSLGAIKTFDGDQVTLFFDYPGNPIAAAKNLLRLRKTADKTQLTFKRFIESRSLKIRDEYEVLVSDFESMRLILESLGLSPTKRMEKHRTSYTLNGGVEVEIDKYAGEYSHIPELLEIEAEDVGTVQLHAKLLGFQPEECKSWTTFDLIDYYSRKKTET